MTTEQTEVEKAGVNFLHHILDQIVEDKDSMIIEANTDDLGVLITLKVSTNDMGKVIGKGGQTIQALRILLRILGGNHSQRVNLKILEP